MEMPPGSRLHYKIFFANDDVNNYVNLLLTKWLLRWKTKCYPIKLLTQTKGCSVKQL